MLLPIPGTGWIISSKEPLPCCRIEAIGERGLPGPSKCFHGLLFLLKSICAPFLYYDGWPTTGTMLLLGGTTPWERLTYWSRESKDWRWGFFHKVGRAIPFYSCFSKWQRERVGILIKVYPVAELFFAPGGPLRVLSTLLFMEEPTPRDKASARGYEAFVRYKRFINKGYRYGSFSGTWPDKKSSFSLR